jgi:predicted TIM-barrel fold metal-dependent hydrolase
MAKVLDTHVHLPTKAFIEETGGDLVKYGVSYFGTKEPVRSLERMDEDFDAAGVDKALLLAWDAETTTGRPRLANETVAEIAKDRSDRFVPILSVDPHKGAKAVEELERAASRLEMRGVKLHPQVQAFRPDAPEHDALWTRIEELALPVVVHTGTSGLGAGAPGGAGIRLDYSRPIHLDAVAAAHPELNLIAAHTGWPWHEELVAMCLQKANVFMDLSGWMPKYLPKEVLAFANGPMRKKVLFGTDYPFLEPKRCLDQFAEAPLKDEVKEDVLWGNGARLFGL